MTQEINVMGLDLSLAEAGIAVPDKITHLTTPAKKWPNNLERLVFIRETVASLATGMNVVFLEGYSYGSQNGGERLGELGGVIRVMLFEDGFPFVEVPPTTLKMFATGRGNAKKVEVVANARSRLGYEGFNDNEADALWLRALGMAAYGQPLVTLPMTHLRALDKLVLPKLRSA